MPGRAILRAYLREASEQTDKFVKDQDAMIVVPGGGYRFVSDREGEPVALNFTRRNYASFVLFYDVAPAYRYPVQLTQFACAVDYIRTHAERFRVNPDRVFAAGFSAGGHLVGNLANFWHDLPKDLLGERKLTAKLNGIVLAYPVIGRISKGGTFRNLTGTDDESDGKVRALKLDRSVSEHNPPCYIWTTAEDASVDPRSVLDYAREYLRLGIPVECHVFPYGDHGAATAKTDTNFDVSRMKELSSWIDEADAFIKII